MRAGKRSKYAVATRGLRYTAVKLFNDIFAVRRLPQVLKRGTNQWLDLLMEEPWKLLNQIHRRGISKRLRKPGFQKFMVQPADLAKIIRIGNLTDQIRRPHQCRFTVNAGIAWIIRHRKAGVFDGLHKTLRMYQVTVRKAVTDIHLTPINMIGRKAGIRGPARRANPVTSVVDDHLSGRVTLTHTARKTDVMDQQRHNVMQPILGLHRICFMLTQKDLLTHQRHHHRMFRIVIGGGGLVKMFQYLARRVIYEICKLRLLIRKNLRIRFSKMIGKTSS